MFLTKERIFVFVVHLLILLHEAEPEILRNRKPANTFSSYTIVQPSLYHGRTKREISSTNSTEGEHHQRVAVELNVDNETLVLDLVLNKDLLTQNYVFSYQQDGKTKKYRPSQKELDICQYNGEVRGRPGSWAAISTCHGLRGVFHDGKTLRYIEPEGTTVKSLHFIYDHSNHVLGNGTEILQAGHRSKRDRPIESDQKMKYNGAPKAVYNGNEQTLYIELVVVIDNRLHIRKPEIGQEVIDLVNIVNSMMAPLNIFVTLVGVKIWRASDEIIINKSSRDTLAAFLKYRFEKLLLEMPNDHATLLTDQIFDGLEPATHVVGLSRKAMCTRRESGSIVSWHSEVLGVVASTLAHEIGHSLGMDHDSENCKCKGDGCLMSTHGIKTTLWSDCSLNSLDFVLKKGGQLCLRNKPRLLNSPVCGNGFIERGEQCDCGVGPGRREGCEACCNPDTCQLRSNASCATGSCCDLQTCQIKPGPKLCREAIGECDLPEYCTGQSEFCPDDVFKMDTTPCGHNEAYCVRGKCRSHNFQCRLLWGQSASNCHNKFEYYNERECGYDFWKRTFLPCKKKDAMLCGRLQCRDPADGEKSELDDLVIATNQVTLSFEDDTVECYGAIIDTGTDEDLGMIPDGAICGKDKMCMDHQCLDVTDVRKRMKIENSICPSDCSGHGVCDSKGNCHCDAGFQPPLCKSPSNVQLQWKMTIPARTTYGFRKIDSKTWTWWYHRF